jgi:hypothetical protein
LQTGLAGSSVVDPVLFDSWVWDPVPGWKKSISRIRDEHCGSYFGDISLSFLGLKILTVLKFFDGDPDLGWKKVRSGIRGLGHVLSNGKTCILLLELNTIESCKKTR